MADDTSSEIAPASPAPSAGGLPGGGTRLDVSATTSIRGGRFPAGSLDDYIYIPVLVPQGVGELQIACDYGPDEVNFLNIGIFGPEGCELGNDAGFRGWSHGGRRGRRRFVISESRATPGYLPGPISPGTWHVALNPHSIGDDGLDWTLVVTMLSMPPARQFVPRLASSFVNDTPGWYRGDLHLHTEHSDGEQTPAEVSARAVLCGLDFIAPTDHNTISAQQHWGGVERPGLLVLCGEEVTTPAGHWGAIGLGPGVWIDFRYRPGDRQLRRFVDRVRGAGGVAICNHPERRTHKGCGWEFDASEMDAIEVWNGAWTVHDEEAVLLWDRLLRSGRRVVAVGGSDSHNADQPIGHPQTVVRAAGLNRDAIIAALRAGHAYVAADSRVHLDLGVESNGGAAGMGGSLVVRPDETVCVTLRTGGVPGSRVTLHTDLGVVHEAVITQPVAAVLWETVSDATRFVRAEVRGPRGEMIALSNPVWIETATGGADPEYLGAEPLIR
ncbi:MAG TPA: CehA/McbA family metallohydrolase [Candidatus Dormibacteraeota bacterium]|nr:CehA/McbA family metallohydrolase [Candidatus Dormibacteraeota bacterium]